VDGKAITPAGTTYTFSKVAANHTIAVTYKPTPPPPPPPPPPGTCTITATAGPGGKISPAGAVKVKIGENQTFTFTPDAGYSIDAAAVDGKPVSLTGATYVFPKVSANHTIGVTFKLGPGTGENSETIKNEIIDLINRERTTRGLPPLARDPLLDKVAQLHSDTGAKSGWRAGDTCAKGNWSGACSHLDWDNRIPEERATFLKYPVPTRTLNGGCTSSYVGENSFQATGYSPSQLPGIAVAAWMKSPGHRRTILDSPEVNNGDTACSCNNKKVACKFTKIGIGISKSAEGKWYINTDFV
jgi:uncharacterized protein YkwD